MIKVIMHGCNGKMGQVISRMISEDAATEMVAGIDCYLGKENDYPTYKTIDECKEKGDVIIDFSNAEATEPLLMYSAKTKTPVVLCTTGLSEAQLEKVNEVSKEVAVLKSANMSMGVNMLLKLLKEAAQVLGPAGFDIELVERHHNQKVDAPSGTALAMADSINEVLNKEYSYNFDRSKERKKREKKEIGVVAVRGGTIVGEHEVIFAGEDEVVEFKHTAYSKAVFAKGAVEAAKFLAGKEAGFYTMNDVVRF